MSPLTSNLCALLDNSAKQLQFAIELLKTRQIYAAWRLLSRLRREALSTAPADLMLLEAKALQLLGQGAEALSLLGRAQTLFPLNPLIANLLFELLQEMPEAAPDLAHNQAWAILKQPTATLESVLAAVLLLQRLKVSPIGLCRFDGQIIAGWLLNSSTLPPLTVTIDGNDYSLQPFATVPWLRQHGLGGEHDGFSLRVPSGEFKHIRIHLNGVDIAGSPILLAEDVDTCLDAGAEASHQADAVINVIVPVYKGYQETRRCLESVLSASNQCDFRLVVVDDATPEPKLKDYLDQLAAELKICLIRQPFNSGFVKSVCRGMAANPNRDVVLLNADTCVNGNWLDRLHLAAYSQADIGTVTPLSNNGELVSYPEPMKSSAMPDVVQLSRLDALCQDWRGQAVVDIPVGVGFCLYIKRACLDAAGGFDSKLIERGYCEDTDFCIRASQAGWRNVCATNVFVAHEGSVSFGGEKAALVAENVGKIYALYPEHGDEYDQFLLQDPLQAVRDYLQSQLLNDFAGEDAELLLMPAETDSDYRRQRIESELGNRPRKVFCLYPDHDRSGKLKISLRSRNLQQPISMHYRWPSDAERLQQDLARLRPKNIDIFDLAVWPQSLLQAIIETKSPYRLLLNNYAGYCWQLNLIKPGEGFCGDPLDAEACLACANNHRSRLKAADGLEHWRQFVSAMFERASAIQLPSPDAVARYRARFPGAAIEYAPADESPIVAATYSAAAPLPDDGILRIAVLQADHPDHGYHNLLALARLMAARQVPAELIVIGRSCDDAALLATGKAWVTGKLDYEEIPATLRRHACQRLLHLPNWPQVDDWPLTIARQCNLPIAAPATGVFATALDAAKGDIVLDCVQNPSACLNAILTADIAMTTNPSQP